jgi:hypothetical protein
MPINISFGGATITRPGAYSAVDTSNMTPRSLGAFKILAVIGVPNVSNTLAGKVAYFNDSAVAKAAIGTSELLDLMSIAWAHGADHIAAVPVAATALDTDWQTSVDLLQNEYVQGILGATTTATINAKLDAHCTLMSNTTNRKERRAFYGHATGSTVTAITALQTALNNERGVMATPGVWYPDATGTLVLKGSHYLAAAYAGLWAGQAPQEPITYKSVKFSKLEKNYSQTEISQLLAGYIAPTEFVPNKGFRIVQGVTLSNAADLTKNELSVSTLKDQMSINLREYFENKYIGQAGVAGVEITMYNDLVSMIEQFLAAGWISGYVKDSVRVNKNGTAFSIEWEGKPTLPINNFLITSHFTL